MRPLSDNLIAISNETEWATILARHSGAHLLQSWPWGELKSRFGWRAVRLCDPDDNAAAQVLFRRLPLGLTIGYLPKGPLMDWTHPQQVGRFLSRLHPIARRQRAVFLKIEPGCNEGMIEPSLVADQGFLPAGSIQPRRTSLLAIDGPEAEILGRMKPKTRYNIRLAGRKGVVVRQGTRADLPAFNTLNQITARRDGFAVHHASYYGAALELFPASQRALLLAEFEGLPLAALIVFAQGRTATYLYGASSNEARQRMPSYLLQWEAIRWARARGCHTYDLWGIPDEAETALEANFAHRGDGLWGVYRFKRGFGGKLVRSAGAFDCVYKPLLYWVYSRVTNRGAA